MDIGTEKPKQHVMLQAGNYDAQKPGGQDKESQPCIYKRIAADTEKMAATQKPEAENNSNTDLN